MNDLVARAVIAVIAVGLGIARWRFHARLPVAAVAVVDWAMSIITALGLTIVVVTALELFLPSLPLFSALAIYAVMYILVEAAIRSVQRQTSILVPGRDDEPDLEFPGLLPIAGPIGRFGPYGLTATFYSSQLLCFFNPLSSSKRFDRKPATQPWSDARSAVATTVEVTGRGSRTPCHLTASGS